MEEYDPIVPPSLLPLPSLLLVHPVGTIGVGLREGSRLRDVSPPPADRLQHRPPRFFEQQHPPEGNLRRFVLERHAHDSQRELEARPPDVRHGVRSPPLLDMRLSDRARRDDVQDARSIALPGIARQRVLVGVVRAVRVRGVRQFSPRRGGRVRPSRPRLSRHVLRRNLRFALLPADRPDTGVVLPRGAVRIVEGGGAVAHTRDAPVPVRAVHVRDDRIAVDVRVVQRRRRIPDRDVLGVSEYDPVPV
mmetsp:Transcript_57713/g.172212  ORF Transcript_57713/g.172212 Transcript_57713/m.172212 type:complete len:248 (-) Transcript_57713:4739-5482(-)